MQTEQNIAPSNPFAPPVAAVTPAVAPAQPAGGFAKWAFAHKETFSKHNPLAWYGVRNAAVNAVSILGLMATIVPVRWAMGHGSKFALSKGFTQLSEELSRPMLQNSLGVGVSFSTFRTLYKTQQRAYDDIFTRPKTEAETAQAVHDLPHKLWENFKQIAKVEYPVTMVAAFALVGIRAGLAGVMPPATALKKKPGELIRDPFVIRDTIGSALVAYPAFFEITDRFGRAGQLAEGYDDPYHNEHIARDKVGVKEFFKRQLPAIAAGIVPYILVNTYAIHNVGRSQTFNATQRDLGKLNPKMLEIDGLAKAFWKERPYLAFPLFTVGRDVYYDLYDRITGKSKEPGEHSALVVPPLPQVAQVTHHGKTVSADQQPALA